MFWNLFYVRILIFSEQNNCLNKVVAAYEEKQRQSNKQERENQKTKEAKVSWQKKVSASSFSPC